MLQFIPFEDDWDALERMRPEDLIPYRVGLLPEPADAGTVPADGAPARSPESRALASRQLPLLQELDRRAAAWVAWSGAQRANR